MIVPAHACLSNMASLHWGIVAQGQGLRFHFELILRMAGGDVCGSLLDAALGVQATWMLYNQRGRNSLVSFQSGVAWNGSCLCFEWLERAAVVSETFADGVLLLGRLAVFRVPWKIKSGKIKSTYAPS